MNNISLTRWQMTKCLFQIMYIIWTEPKYRITTVKFIADGWMKWE
jgi:hypothetical protein